MNHWEEQLEMEATFFSIEAKRLGGSANLIRLDLVARAHKFKDYKQAIRALEEGSSEMIRFLTLQARG